MDADIVLIRQQIIRKDFMYSIERRKPEVGQLARVKIHLGIFFSTDIRNDFEIQDIGFIEHFGNQSIAVCAATTSCLTQIKAAHKFRDRISCLVLA